MDYDATKEQWIDRFALRLAQLEVGATPEEFLRLAGLRWPTAGHLSPDDAAESEHDNRHPAEESHSDASLDAAATKTLPRR